MTALDDVLDRRRDGAPFAKFVIHLRAASDTNFENNGP
jgi:hypothetical protein